MPILRRSLGITLSASLVAIALLVAAPAPALAATWVVDDDAVQCPDRTHTTIQDAVNDASPGDTIEVCAGTYTENVVLNKSLTLNGAQAGVDACGRDAADESTVSPALIPAPRTLELRTGSAVSIIDGFTFLGGSRAIESTSGPINDLQLLNNRIHGFTNAGVFLNDTGLNITVHQNEIDGTSKVGGGGLVHLDTDNFDGFWFTNNCVVNGTAGTGFFVDGTRNVDENTTGARTPQFTGNFIDNNGTGTNLGRGAWGGGPISGNTFSNNRFDGLQGGPKNSLISENTFDNNGRSGLALTSFGNVNPNFSGTGMTAGAQGNNIAQNCFTGNGFLQAGEGIFFSSAQAANTISTNVAHQNNIFDNATGARYVGAETIDAEQNWWGSSTGPTHVNNPGGTGDAVVDVGDGIDYDPFLTSVVSGTLCVPPPPPLPPTGKATGGGQVPVPEGRGSFGFNARLDEGEATGHLNYRNHVTRAHLNCTVTTFIELSPTTATFSGTCNPQSSADSFTAHVEDHGEPGKDSDVFEITYNGITEGGTLTAGNIQIGSEPAAAASSTGNDAATAATLTAGSITIE